jgi:hypothetical protein
MSASPFGLGLPDFNRPGLVRVVDAYRRKKKYKDIHSLGQSLESCLRLPTTFDGKLPSEAFGHATSRVKIGETYFFPDAGEGGTTAVVDGVTVMEDTKTMMVFITANGQSQILNGPMSDTEFSEYKEFGEAYFGRVPLQTGNQTKDPFHFFEWLMEVNQATPRLNMLDWFAPTRDRAELENLSDEELRMVYCEGHVGAMKFE